jgi:peptidoglycan/xylan/chitin deacetylase (PgdA/CDA1 family)
MLALSFHAEKIHHDGVWRRLLDVAERTAKRGIKATFFVYPFPADVIGRDITARVKALSGLGHEIAQHTHFYAGTEIKRPDKADDLSDANVIHCLERDLDTLRRMSVEPKGFTAGAWICNETVLDSLARLGFAYDCSARFPKRNRPTEGVAAQWLSSPEIRTMRWGRLVRLPTTCSLGEWFLWGRRVEVPGPFPYRLVYLHDYDLLNARVRLILRLLLQRDGNASSTVDGIRLQMEKPSTAVQ